MNFSLPLGTFQRAASYSRRAAAARRAVESLETRAMLAADVAAISADIAADTNADGSLTTADILGVVSHLRDSGPRRLEGESPLRSSDVNRDGSLTVADALVAVQRLRIGGPRWIGPPEVFDGRIQLISDAQRENIQQLFADLSAIRADSDVGPELVAELMQSVRDLVEGATLPSEESVAAFQATLTAAREDGEISPQEMEQLTSDLEAVLASANVTPEELQAVRDDIQAIAEATNISQDDIDTIVADLQAIVEEFQNRDPLVSDAQRENIQQLVATLQEIADGSLVTPAMIAELRAGVRALFHDAQLPSLHSVLTLIGDVRDARADGEVTDDERAVIGESLDGVLTSANIPQEERDAVLASWNSIVEASGVTQEDLQAIANDLAAIRDEFWNNRGGRVA